MGSRISTTPAITDSAAAEYQALEAAAEWYATLHDEAAGTAERMAWQAWLKQSEAHARAWAHIEAVSQRFAPLRAGGHQAALAGIKAARPGAPGRRQMLAGLAGAVGLGLAGWLGWRHTALPEMLLAWSADYRTAIGEQRQITLADGSQVWLNTHTALSVDYRAEARLLSLAAGEILIQTGHDPHGRPFYVDTRHGRMQALGTRFSVFHEGGQTRLNVFESTVELSNRAGDKQRVDAGQRTAFNADGIAPIQPAERAREAWRRGLVVAENISLQVLINDLARYQGGHISVAPEVAGLSVMGVYPAHDFERALAMLENTLPIRIRLPLPWWVTVEARP